MTAKDLYDTLIRKPDLHSVPELIDNVLIWHLYDNAYIRAWCDGPDTGIEIAGCSLLSGAFMHWHPEEADMLEQLYALGKKGNLLVLKKTLFGTGIFYMGPSENYPFADGRKLHFGRKKWDGGRLIYFEQV